MSDTAIVELLKGGLVKGLANRPHVINPLTVSINGKGNERLILDLRHVKKQEVLNKIKFEPKFNGLFESPFNINIRCTELIFMKRIYIFYIVYLKENLCLSFYTTGPLPTPNVLPLYVFNVT
jgi:hypothetical protein